MSEEKGRTPKITIRPETRRDRPAYYPRFGFRNAKEYGIRTSDGGNMDPFMALELSKNSLKVIEGGFYEDPVYRVGSDELERFEKSFPPREKHVTDTQLK